MASSNQLLAEHYLKCAGIGAICIEIDGSVTMYETVGLDVPAGVIVLCFNSGDAGQIAGLLQTCRGDQATTRPVGAVSQ